MKPKVAPRKHPLQHSYSSDLQGSEGLIAIAERASTMGGAELPLGLCNAGEQGQQEPEVGASAYEWF